MPDSSSRIAPADPHLLADYFSGALSEEEVRLFEARLAGDPLQAREVAGLRKKWALRTGAEAPADSARAWETIASHIHAVPIEAPVVRRKRAEDLQRGTRAGRPAKLDRWRSLWWGALGGVLVLFTGLTVEYFPAGFRSASAEYATQRGEQREIALPDGSRVVLAPATHLQYHMRNGKRVVLLQGQAYFSVTHQPDHPFMVQSGDVTTQVLGTSFVVRSYATDSATQIAVAEGKVAVDAGTSATVLLAGDVGVADMQGRVTVKHDLRIGNVFGWMRGQLSFDDTPVAKAAKDLERAYDVTIRFADSVVPNRRLTAVFAGESVTEMLDLLALTVDARYTADSASVVFEKR